MMGDWGDESVDLDGGEASGDRMLDEFGYQGKRDLNDRMRQREQRRHISAAERNEAIRDNKQRTAERQRERRGHRAVAPQPAPRPAILTGDELPPRAALEITRNAPRQAPGWYAVRFGDDGTARWSPVDQPEPGHAAVSAYNGEPLPAWNPLAATPAPEPRRRWWQRRRRPIDPPASPGTQLW
jgi:hypothetical protein